MNHETELLHDDIIMRKHVWWHQNSQCKARTIWSARGHWNFLLQRYQSVFCTESRYHWHALNTQRLIIVVYRVPTHFQKLFYHTFSITVQY